jgi:hypothetical protein
MELFDPWYDVQAYMRGSTHINGREPSICSNTDFIELLQSPSITRKYQSHEHSGKALACTMENVFDLRYCYVRMQTGSLLRTCERCFHYGGTHSKLS